MIIALSVLRNRQKRDATTAIHARQGHICSIGNYLHDDSGSGWRSKHLPNPAE